MLGGAVFWPLGAEPGASLVSVSDHRLVYVDLRLEPFVGQAVPDLHITIDGADVVLTWSASVGIAYSVECSADLAGEGPDELGSLV